MSNSEPDAGSRFLGIGVRLPVHDTRPMRNVASDDW